MGIELARAYITVAADSSRIGPDLDRVKAEVESQLQAINTGVAAILGTAIFKLGKLLAGSIDTAQFFEKIETQMGVLMKSASDAKKMVADLVKFGTKTPFQIPELMQYAQQLLAVGVANERVIPSLKMLGDAALGDREKFGRLLYVFKEVQSKGKLMGNDFMQITGTGAISAKLLAEAFKITEQQANSMIRNLSKEQLVRYFEIMTSKGGRFADMMKVTSSTLEGLKSNFQDSTIYIRKFIGEPLVPYMKSLYIAMTDVLLSVSEFLRIGGEMTSFALVGAAAYGTLQTALYGAGLAARFFGVQLRFMLFLKAGWIAGSILAIGAAIGALASYFEVPKKLGLAFEWLKNKIETSGFFVQNMRLAWERMKETARLMIGHLLRMLKQIPEMFDISWEDIWKKFDEMVTKVIARIGDMTLDFVEWNLVFARHFRELWDALPKFVDLGASIMIDVFNNAIVIMIDRAKTALIEFVRSIPTLFMKLGGLLLDIADKIGQGIFDAITGKKKGGLFGANEQKAIVLDFEKMINDVMKPSGRRLGDWSEHTKKIFEEVQGLMRRMRESKDELEKNRVFRFNIDNKAGEGDKKSDKTTPAELMKPGVFQIPELGRKLQESALKSGQGMEINIAKMVGIGEAQKGIQEQQLKALEKLNPGLA